MTFTLRDHISQIRPRHRVASWASGVDLDDIVGIRQLVHAHTKRCPECRSVQGQLAVVRDALHEIEVPETLRTTLMSSLPELTTARAQAVTPERRRVPTKLAWSAAAMAGLVVGVALLRKRRQLSTA